MLGALQTCISSQLALPARLGVKGGVGIFSVQL